MFGGESMADGTTVDNLQIEITASSDDAVNRITRLTSSLRDLQSATRGKFGDVKTRMKDVGGPSDSLKQQNKALEEIQKKREALERAAARPESVVPKDIISNEVESAKKKYDELIRYINQNSGRITRDAASAALREIEAEKNALERIIDQFGDAVAPPELNAVLDALKHAETEFRDIWANPAPQRIDWGAVQRQTESFGPQERADKTEVIESEESLERKRGILQRIGDLISEISGKKVDIKTPDGLKDLLSRDLSLQNLIPKGFEKAIDALKNSFGGMTNKVLEFASAHPAAAAAMIGLKSAAQTVFRAMKDFASLSFSALKTGLQTAASAAKKLGSALAGLAGAGIRKLASGLKSVGKYLISDFTKPFQAATKAVIRWKNAIGRIVFMRAVRGVIRTITEGFKTGTDNLYQYSKMVGTEFAPAMDKLATSALYLKNSLGAMAAPIIEAVAPAIDILVDKFVDLMNAAGKTFAALTGKSVYTQARKHAVEYAEAAEDAEEKTKEFKKFLLGIDELNIMPSQDEDKEEKKNPLEDYKSMFEEVSIPVEQMDWAKQIREAIENGDWYSVGRIVAEKLNELVDGWDSFAWGKNLGQKITNALKVAFGFLENFNFENLGKKVAEAINGLFEGIDWDLLGRTFAEKWNSLFEFIYGLATNLKWAEIGLNIAQMINGFLDQLDAKKAAEAVSKFITGLFEMINTAITETNWALLGEKLAEFINNVDWYGIIYGGLSIITNGLAALKEGIDSFLENWEWEDMAEQIYTAINDALKNVDWKGIGDTLGNLFITAFNFIREVIAGIQWDQIGSDISQFIQGINLGDVAKSFLNMVKTLVDGIVASIKSFLEETPPEVLATLVEVVGAVALGFAALMTKSKTLILAEGIAVLIAIFNEFGDQLINLAGQLAADFNEFVKGIDWSEVGKYIGDGLINAINALTKLIQDIDWAAIARAIVDFLAGVDWVGLAMSLVDAMVSMLGAVAEAVVGLITKIPDLILIGVEIIGGILLGIVKAIADLPGWLFENIITPFIDGLIELPEALFGLGENMINNMLEGIKKAFSGLFDFLERAKNKVLDIWNTITGKTSEATASSSSLYSNSATNRVRAAMPQNFEAPKAYASGGFPQKGEMFIAREAGPELVGKIGQKNTVANNEQITSGIADGVRDANTDVVNAVYAMASMIVKSIEDKNTDITLDGQSLARGIQTYEKRLSSIQGRSLIN